MRVKTVLVLLCLGLCQSGNAQGQSQTKDPLQSDLSTLRTDMRALQAEQQQIITRLDELKKLLQPNSEQVPPKPPSTLDIRGEKFRGDAGAVVAIVEYADYQCPYCGEYEQTVFPHLLADYIQTGKVKYFYRDLPLSMHSLALPAARAARCAGEQGKYWEFHDSLFAKQNALSASAILDRAKTLGLDNAKFTECLSSDKFNEDIHKSISDAEKMGIDGTPTFFIGIIDGDVVNIKAGIKGTSPIEIFKTRLDALLSPSNKEVVSAH